MPPYGRGIPKAGTGFEGSPDGKMAGACCLHPNGGLRQMAEEREIGSASLSWSQPLAVAEMAPHWLALLSWRNGSLSIT